MSDLFVFDDLPGPDTMSGERVRKRAASVLRPTGALERLDSIAIWLAEWQRTDKPKVERPAVLVFVADHGVAIENVSAYPIEVTRAMYEALSSGVATAAVMARLQGANLEVIDVGVGAPTRNIRFESAMDDLGFEWAFSKGRDSVVALDSDVLILGEMGIGNTTAAAAVAASLTGNSVTDMVGRGTGLDDVGQVHKRKVVREALDRVGHIGPFDSLRELGGFEMVAMAGAAYEARRRSIPILLDGYVVAAALMPFEYANPGSLAHCWPAHLSPEPGHRVLIDKLGRPPILDLEMRLGEASGALAALPLVRLAAAGVVEVATFEEWGLT